MRLQSFHRAFLLVVVVVVDMTSMENEIRKIQYQEKKVANRRAKNVGSIPEKKGNFASRR